MIMKFHSCDLPIILFAALSQPNSASMYMYVITVPVRIKYSINMALIIHLNWFVWNVNEQIFYFSQVT